MIYKTHTTTNPYLDQVRSHKEPYTTTVLDKEIIVFPSVMSPKYDWSPSFHIKNMPDQKGKTFLEIGCGSGVLSLFAGLQGAKKIVAVDINENAVNCATANFEKYNLKNADAIYSNLFENVTGTFDTINFAAPYHGNKPADILEYGVSDENYQTLRSFLRQAGNYLNPDGQIILGFSNTGDLNLLNKLIIENYLVVHSFKEEEKDGWKAYLYILKPIIFNNPLEKFIYDDDYKWFKHYSKFTREGKILKVGHGLGYASYFIKLHNPNITNLDITVQNNAILPKDITLYDGQTLPYKNNEFDTVICAYTLHHVKDNQQIFNEIIRVTKDKIVIIEETYETPLQKLHLIINCWKANRKAGQAVKIFWESYFSGSSIRQLFADYGLKTIKHNFTSRKTFKVELFILQKPPK